MGVDLHGWIEAKRWAHDDYRGIVDAGLIEVRSYEIYSKLFGVRDVWDYNPIAADRGLPAGYSEQVKNNFFDDGNLDDPKGYNLSWVGWDEIKNQIPYLLEDVDELAKKYWVLMFKLMHDMAETYGQENVRLVVYFH